MNKRFLSKYVGVLTLVAVVSLLVTAAFLFIGPDRASVSEGEAVSAYVATPPPGLTPPPSPVGTYQPPISSPEPPFVYPTPPPLPPPPVAVILTPGPTTSATAPIPTVAPAPSVTASAGKEGIKTGLPNIAWGQETSDGAVTLWTGTYSDLPSPNIDNIKALVQWPPAPNPDWGLASTLELDGLAFSPDGQYLAVQLLQHREGEGVSPWRLYAVDLSTGSAQHMPDYSSYTLYEQFYTRPADTILGWIDNSRVAAHQSGSPSRVVIFTKDGTTYSEVPFGSQYSHVSDSALSPDRQTFFSFVVGEGISWLYNIDGSNPQQLIGDEGKFGNYPKWSPDGEYISFVAPGQRVENGTEYPDFDKSGVWLLNVDTSEQQLVTGDDIWNSTPAWSLDAATLAFLRSDAPVTNESASPNHPENVSTNLFTIDIDSLDISRLTSFTGVKNSSLQWTPWGNILASSTAAGSSGTRGIVAISSFTGNSTTLVSSVTSQQLEHPTLFAGEGMPGMPRTGERVVKP